MEDFRLRLIKESIKHWCYDILKPLNDGKVIIIVYNDALSFYFKWKETDTVVKCYETHCPLCVYYISNKNNYEKCPLYIEQDFICCGEADHLAWNKFNNNPCRKTAIGMIRKLAYVYHRVKNNF